LHRWAFDRLTSILTGKAKIKKDKHIEVLEVAEHDTSEICGICSKKDNSRRVGRGLYVCESCDSVFNADVNAENICPDTTNVAPSRYLI
jgi:putative transposase